MRWPRALPPTIARASKPHARPAFSASWRISMLKSSCARRCTSRISAAVTQRTAEYFRCGNPPGSGLTDISTSQANRFASESTARLRLASRRSLAAVSCGHAGRNAASRAELARDREESRGNSSNDVIEDLVHHVLVEDPLVAVRLQVELEAAQLDAAEVRRVADDDRPEIRLPGHRADARELRCGEFDLVVAFGELVFERIDRSIGFECVLGHNVSVRRPGEPCNRDRPGTAGTSREGGQGLAWRRCCGSPRSCRRR